MIRNLTLVEKLQPIYAPSSTSPPTPHDEEITKTLENYLNAEAPLETKEGTAKRGLMLHHLGKLAEAWVLGLQKTRGFASDADGDAEGSPVRPCKLFISGSYRLGVNHQNADVDTVLVAPNYITREDFFSEHPQEGLTGLLRGHPSVSRVMPIPTAKVPIIEMVWEGVEVDVLFARLASGYPLPQDHEQLLDDAILSRTDEATVLSLNGPRVTEMLVKFVENMGSYNTFLILLRSLRLWAKRKGIYSNKMGFLGGVNFNIIAVFALQLYPKETASKILLRLMFLLRDWKFPAPIRLCRPYQVLESCATIPWDDDPSHVRHHMPIITPAYPNFNSSINVTVLTLKIMTKEFVDGHAALQKLFKKKHIMEGDWGEFFAKSDFFVRFKLYLSVNAVVEKKTLQQIQLEKEQKKQQVELEKLQQQQEENDENDEGEEEEQQQEEEKEDLPKTEAEMAEKVESDLKKWSGFVESRIRRLVEIFEQDKKIPIHEAHPYPEAFEINSIAAGSEEGGGGGGGASAGATFIGTRWFIGIRMNPYLLKSTKPTINLEGTVNQFVHGLSQNRMEGMDVAVQVLKFKDMVRQFPALYPAKTLEQMVLKHNELQQIAIKELEKATLSRKTGVTREDETNANTDINEGEVTAADEEGITNLGAGTEAARLWNEALKSRKRPNLDLTTEVLEIDDRLEGYKTMHVTDFRPAPVFIRFLDKDNTTKR